ncbi:Flp family type IVb pilin [Leisingera sp. D0M16]|uniref:Flp family type IVb pilin n=1 Tax=Leisingera coralii TaxID=3351347 RepID=UPI003B7F13E7
MIKFFKNFRKDESGAVTVDWVVLTAAVAALGGVVYTAIESGASDLTSATGSYLSTQAPS